MTDRLAGTYFHSIVDGEIEWQGQVLARIELGVYLIETYSFLNGAPSFRYLVSLETMMGWRFYETADKMNSHYEQCSRWR